MTNEKTKSSPVAKPLRLTRFGNPILRKKARELSEQEILGDEVQGLVQSLVQTNGEKNWGVGIAAPQVGVPIALSMIDIRPNQFHPDMETYFQIIINPIYEGIGKRASMWEGCLSSGNGSNTLFGKALRWRKIRAKWYDENAVLHEEELSGIRAHVFQHETDHLNGILFVDRVRDSRTFMLGSEYRKRIQK